MWGLDAVRSRSVPLAICTHLFDTDDHADAMAALGAMEAAPVHAENVVPLWG
jgi:hypothetical protein